MQQIIVRALDLTEAAHFLFKNKPKIDPQDGNVECAAHAHRFMIAAITLGDLLSLRTGGQSPVSIGWPLSIFTQLTILRNHLMAFWTCSRLDKVPSDKLDAFRDYHDSRTRRGPVTINVEPVGPGCDVLYASIEQAARTLGLLITDFDRALRSAVAEPQQTSSPSASYLGLNLDRARGEIRRDGFPPVRLTRLLLRNILELLMKNGDAFVDDQEIRKAWPDSEDGGPERSTIRVAIHELRQKLS